MTQTTTFHRGKSTTTVPFGRFALGVFAFLALCGLITILGSKDAADAAGAIGVMFGAGVAGGLFISRARTLDGRERTGWSLIGFGMASASLGVFVVAVVYFVQGDAPAFGWTDLFFLATYVLVILGASALPHAEGSTTQRARMFLDGLIGAVSIAALAWVLLLSDMTSGLADASLLTRTIGAFYPFLDLVVLTVAMTVLLRRSRHRFDVRVALFAVAVSFQVLGDISLFASAQSGSFQDANPLYWINLLAMGFFVASASFVGKPSVTREYADRNPPLWTQIAPNVPALMMLAVFMVELATGADAAGNRILLGAMILVGLLVIARQALLILDNRATIEQQRDLLVTTISHELRTPLTAVVGYVDILSEDRDRLEPDQVEMVGIIQEQADYMSTIVSDLIMLARGTDGGLELDVEAVPVKELTEASVLASNIGVETVKIEGSDDLVVFADHARMQQVLVNLLTNAARYGGPERIMRIISDGSDVTFEVHDDGPGVPRRHEVRIWDRFDRGPNRLNATTPGSGIGLAVVAAIAEAHGGSTGYRTSELLGGACFSVALPGRATREPLDEEPSLPREHLRSIA